MLRRPERLPAEARSEDNRAWRRETRTPAPSASLSDAAFGDTVRCASGSLHLPSETRTAIERRQPAPAAGRMRGPRMTTATRAAQTTRWSHAHRPTRSIHRPRPARRRVRRRQGSGRSAAARPTRATAFVRAKVHLRRRGSQARAPSGGRRNRNVQHVEGHRVQQFLGAYLHPESCGTCLVAHEDDHGGHVLRLCRGELGQRRSDRLPRDRILAPSPRRTSRPFVVLHFRECPQLSVLRRPGVRSLQSASTAGLGRGNLRRTCPGALHVSARRRRDRDRGSPRGRGVPGNADPHRGLRRRHARGVHGLRR